MTRRLVSLFLGLAALLTMARAEVLAPEAVGSLQLIGLREIPTGTKFGETTFGGLSALVYDAPREEWIGPSDDRGKLNYGPPRVYRLRIRYDATALVQPEIVGLVPIPALPPGEEPDYEAIAIDPLDGSRWLATEGDGRVGISPRLVRMTATGEPLPAPDLPAMMRFSKDPLRGPHHNETTESLAFSPDGERLWVALEDPFKQDGDLARFTALRRDGSVARQVAYRLAPVDGEAATRDGRSGISEILPLAGGKRFLALERTGWQDAAKVWRFGIRLWEIDLAEATDVSAMDSLAEAAAAGVRVQPVAKRLLVDFATLGQNAVYNLECLAWGPRLSDGRAVLVVAADDNFDVNQATQFWVFAVEPPAAQAASAP